MTADNKAPFTFDEAIQRGLAHSPEEKLADDAFHAKRIMFAFVDDNGNPNPDILLYRAKDSRDHARWLHQRFGIDAGQFENITRGYISLMDDNSCRCIIYKGIDHNPTTVTEKHQAAVCSLWETCFSETKILNVYTGCKIGRIGEVWEPIQDVAQFNKDSYESLLKKAYEAYKIRWMKDHGHTIKELLEGLQEQLMLKAGSDRLHVTFTQNELKTLITDVFSEWEMDNAFSGECYACENEFENTEFKIPWYMTETLSGRMLETYNRYIPYINRGLTNIYAD